MYGNSRQQERERRSRGARFTTCRAGVAPAQPLQVTVESITGRNLWFLVDGRHVDRSQLVREIRSGLHPHYHVRVINGIETPVSNPDSTRANNLR